MYQKKKKEKKRVCQGFITNALNFHTGNGGVGT
jgi:hypothetical protein